MIARDDHPKQLYHTTIELGKRQNYSFQIRVSTGKSKLPGQNQHPSISF